MAITLTILVMSLSFVAGYQIKENTETIRRVKAEEETEQARQELAETKDKLSRSYSRVECQTRGTMPELHI